jgi:hypothetical protein
VIVDVNRLITFILLRLPPPAMAAPRRKALLKVIILGDSGYLPISLIDHRLIYAVSARHPS